MATARKNVGRNYNNSNIYKTKKNENESFTLTLSLKKLMFFLLQVDYLKKNIFIFLVLSQ